MEESNDGFARDHLKTMEVCGKVVELCHKRLFSDQAPIDFDGLKTLMFCLREAWVLSSSQLHIIGDADKLNGLMDDESGEEDDEDDDDSPPHPLK